MVADEAALLDLATELWRFSRGRHSTALALDRIWMRDNGRIVLLDFAPPDAPAGSRRSDAGAVAAGRGAACRGILRAGGSAAVGPGVSRAVVRAAVPAIADARAALLAMTAAPNSVHWWRRDARRAGGRAGGLMLLVADIIPALGRLSAPRPTDMMNLLGALEEHDAAADNPCAARGARAAEVAVAGRYAHLIRDESFWKAGVVRWLAPDYRALAEDILAASERGR